MISHRVFHYDDVSLLTVPADDKNSNIMHKFKFYYSAKHKNWVYKIPADQINFEYARRVLNNVSNAHEEYIKRYKMLPQKSEVKRSLIKVFDKLPNEISQKISDSVSYDCTCANNVVCLACTHACCAKAKQRWCMCLIAFECETHGIRCIGSHD